MVTVPHRDPDVEALQAGRHDLFLARQAQLREGMRANGVAAMVVGDPNHVLYATGARNMQLWSMRAACRYLLILADGPSILFDAPSQHHLALGLPTLDDVRPSIGLDFLTSGGDVLGAAGRFAAEIAGLVRDHDPVIDLLHVDRLPWQAVDALRAEGFAVADALEPLCLIRAIKLPVELPYMREAMRRVEEGTARLEGSAEPGRTEAETWAEFHHALMAKEGQYVSTRLFQAGPGTYPYFQEASARALREGDILCLDTDALGFENYAVDFSRTFLCGQGRATDDQRTLYGRAREQLEHNAALLAPGVEYREIAERAWPIPEEHMDSRYYCVGHGLGLAGEFPNIPHLDAGRERYPLEGHLLPGMVICLESYVGWDRSREGVKLEDQYLITETGAERMSRYPFDERLQTRMI